MRKLGIDYGDSRVGISITDGLNITVQGLETIHHQGNDKIVLKRLEEILKEALNVATLAKVKTIRYIDKILLEWKRREEFSKNGVSPLSEKWRKNLEETMEIAKINWMEE